MSKMKMKLAATVFASVASIAASSVGASVWNGDCDLVPYVGIDAQWRHMSFKKDFGKDQTAENYPQGNAYVGLKVTPFFGVELGYESTTNKNKNSTVLGRDRTFGFIFLPDEHERNQSFNFKTKTKIHGPHLDFVGFLPISDEYCLDLVGSLGVAYLKSKATFTLQDPLAPSLSLTSKSKWVARVGLGVQQMITDQFGVRAMATWENTSQLKLKVKGKNEPSGRTEDSFILGLGLFFNFA